MKTTAKFVSAALAAAMFAGCSSSASDTSKSADSSNTAAASSASNSERTTFTVGFDAEFPPYGYKDENGEYTGFDLEMAQAVADLEGWELVKQPIDWASKDMELSSGTIDCIWNGFTMNGREDSYTFSDPYIDNSQVFVVPADSNITTAADLAGLNVGVQKDSSALAALEDEENADLKNSFAALTQYDDYNTALMDMQAGGIDAVAMDIGVAEYQISKNADKYKKLEEPLSSENYAVGFLKGNTELRDLVQEDIYELYDNGTVDELAEKYGLSDFIVIGDYKK